MARHSPVRPVLPAWIAAASIPGSRCGDGTSVVAIEGFLRFSVSHETNVTCPGAHRQTSLGHCWTFFGEDGFKAWQREWLKAFVSSAVEAPAGGPPVEPRKTTGPKVPSGTTDSSPRGLHTPGKKRKGVAKSSGVFRALAA